MTLYKRLFLSLILVVSCFKAAHARIDYVDMPTSKLSRLIYVYDDFLPIVNMQIAFKDAGFVQDPTDMLGLSRVYLNLANGMNFSADYKTLQELMSRKAIELSFSADQENFYINLKFINSDYRYVARILNKFFTEHDFSDQFLELSKKDLMAIRKQKYKDSNYLLALNFQRLVFAGSKYSESSYGSDDTIANIGLEDVEIYQEGRFARDNLHVSIVGDMKQREISNFIDLAFAGLKKEHALSLPEVKIASDFFEEVLYKEKEQIIIKAAIQAPSRSDSDYFAFYLFDEIMGGSNFSSRLGSVLREEKGLTYGVYSYLTEIAAKNLWMITFSTSKEKYSSALNELELLISNLKQNPISEEELKLAKDRYRESYEIYFATNDKIADYMLQAVIAGEDPNLINTQVEEIEKVSLEDVRKIANNIQSFSSFATVSLGDF